MGGPPKTPREVKRLRGTLREDRDPAPLTILPPVQPGDPPEVLGEAGVRAWHGILQHVRWLAESDMLLVRMLCEAMDRRADFIANLDALGPVLYTDKGYAYQNPTIGALATTEAQISKWLSLLGLSPADRTKLGVAEVKGKTALEQLREKQAQRLERAGRRAT